MPVSLSRRELAIAAMFANGASLQQISYYLGLTRNTAKAYLARARRKYEAAGYNPGTNIRLLMLLEDRSTWRISSVSRGPFGGRG
jgi:DNA-binding NarL/FixJ family response regulator